jgi:hypothetical protein
MVSRSKARASPKAGSDQLGDTLHRVEVEEPEPGVDVSLGPTAMVAKPSVEARREEAHLPRQR